MSPKKERIPVPEAKKISIQFVQEFREYSHELDLVRGMEMNIQRELPNYVRAIRAAYGQITQSELAEEVGVDYTYISKIENGRASPTVELLERLAHFVMRQENGKKR